MASTLRVSNGRHEWLVSVEGSAVSIDGVEGTFVVEARPDGTWTITHADGTSSASAARTAQTVWTGLNGAASEWTVQPASSRTRHKVVDDVVRAPMSATVVRVHVAAGATVSEGDPLVVVEAMKMEMPLRAPRAGTVAAVHCREGELVQAAAVLVELE
jgi:biotin carboxyl carrier protein